MFTVFTKLLKCVHKKQKTTRFPSDLAVGPILLEFSGRQPKIQNSRVYLPRGVMASQHSWAICFFWGANCPIIERLRERIMLRVRADAMVAQAHISRGEPGAEFGASTTRRPSMRRLQPLRRRTITGAIAPVEPAGAAMSACHSNALDRPNSRPKLRCRVTPVVAQIFRALPTAGIPKPANDSAERCRGDGGQSQSLMCSKIRLCGPSAVRSWGDMLTAR